VGACGRGFDSVLPPSSWRVVIGGVRRGKQAHALLKLGSSAAKIALHWVTVSVNKAWLVACDREKVLCLVTTGWRGESYANTNTESLPGLLGRWLFVGDSAIHFFHSQPPTRLTPSHHNHTTGRARDHGASASPTAGTTTHAHVGQEIQQGRRTTGPGSSSSSSEGNGATGRPRSSQGDTPTPTRLCFPGTFSRRNAQRRSPSLLPDPRSCRTAQRSGHRSNATFSRVLAPSLPSTTNPSWAHSSSSHGNGVSRNRPPSLSLPCPNSRSTCSTRRTTPIRFLTPPLPGTTTTGRTRQHRSRNGGTTGPTSPSPPPQSRTGARSRPSSGPPPFHHHHSLLLLRLFLLLLLFLSRRAPAAATA